MDYVSEPHQLPPKKRPILQEQAIPRREPPKKKSKIVIKHIPINPESFIPPSEYIQYTAVYIQTTADVQPLASYIQPLAAANVQPSTSAAADVKPLAAAGVQPSTSAAADVQPSTSAAADVQPSTSAAADVQPTAPGTDVILDFGKARLPKQTNTEFDDIFQVVQPSLEIDGAIDFENSQKKMDKLYKQKIKLINPSSKARQLSSL